jgi:hypothetical protein
MRFKLAVFVIAVTITVGAPAFTAAPAYAGDHRKYRHHYQVHRPMDHPRYQMDYSGYLDPNSGHYDPQFQRNRENFGFSGRDPSRVGGIDPSLNPPGMGR